MEKVSLIYKKKNEEETYEKIIDMNNNSDYTTGNLLDFAYFKKTLQINCNGSK